jgi:hypothetical protein
VQSQASLKESLSLCIGTFHPRGKHMGKHKTNPNWISRGDENDKYGLGEFNIGGAQKAQYLVSTFYTITCLCLKDLCDRKSNSATTMRKIALNCLFYFPIFPCTFLMMTMALQPIFGNHYDTRFLFSIKIFVFLKQFFTCLIFLNKII